MGPIRLYKYYTAQQLADLQAAIIDRMTNGAITSVGGAAKTSSQEYMELVAQQQSIQFEMDQRAGVQRPQRVEQVIVRPYSEDVLSDGFPLG